MKKSTKGGLMFLGIIVAAFMIGDYILSATFFGIVMLVGLVVLVESMSPLKWFVRKTSKIIDVLIFGVTAISMASFGLNMTAALTIAGVGYTLVYAPYLREQSPKKQPRADYSQNFNRK